MKRKELGYAGEERAAEYLEKKGYRVISRNYTVRGGEIDLVVCDRMSLVFVEVKTRTDERFGRAAEAVDARKISRMVKAAEHFLYENGERYESSSKNIRFDVIEVYTSDDRLVHIPNIEIQ